MAPTVGVGVSTFELWGAELRIWDANSDVPESSAQPRRTLRRRWERIRFIFVKHSSEGPIRLKTELIGPVSDVPWED